MLISSGGVCSLSGEIIGFGVGVTSGDVIGVGVGVMSGEVIGVGVGVMSGEVIGVLSGEVIGGVSVGGIVPELLPPPQPPASIATVKSHKANKAQNFLAAMKESLLRVILGWTYYITRQKKSGTLPKSWNAPAIMRYASDESKLPP